MKTTPIHILIVDDDDRIRTLLERVLRRDGFAVSVASDAADARRVLRLLQPDLAVVDVMMPGETGLELANFLTGSLHLPVILLTALGESRDRIAGLLAGADDYLVKPFEPQELTLRIAAVLRRQRGAAGNENTNTGRLAFGGYVLDLTGNTLQDAAQQTVNLSDGEMALLRVLAERPNAPCSREALIHALDLKGQDRTIDVQVGRLRRRLGDDGENPEFLLTLRGKGYMLKADKHD